MDELVPSTVPVYETKSEGQSLWQRCAERRLPVVAIRAADRGYIVRYDVDHLDRRLSPSALRELRKRVRTTRQYAVTVDPVSPSENLGGEAGPVAGDLHAETEQGARRLAALVSAFIFDADNLL